MRPFFFSLCIDWARTSPSRPDPISANRGVAGWHQPRGAHDLPVLCLPALRREPGLLLFVEGVWGVWGFGGFGSLGVEDGGRDGCATKST